jgi:hypothetical protein
MPTFGKPAASIALPHPPKTSQNVPINSAKFFFSLFFLFSYSFGFSVSPRFY